MWSNNCESVSHFNFTRRKSVFKVCICDRKSVVPQCRVRLNGTQLKSHHNWSEIKYWRFDLNTEKYEIPGLILYLRIGYQFKWSWPLSTFPRIWYSFVFVCLVHSCSTWNDFWYKIRTNWMCLSIYYFIYGTNLLNSASRSRAPLAYCTYWMAKRQFP